MVLDEGGGDCIGSAGYEDHHSSEGLAWRALHEARSEVGEAALDKALKAKMMRLH